MLPVLTAAEMRAADRATIEEVGLPGAVLMENAGAAVAAAARGALSPGPPSARVCGKGNNGGDGFVVARRLLRPWVPRPSSWAGRTRSKATRACTSGLRAERRDACSKLADDGGLAARRGAALDAPTS